MLDIDHDEATCDKGQHCIYTIAIISQTDNMNTGEEATNQYDLEVNFVQKNYQILSAETPEVAVVDKNSLRYFKYI